MHGFDSNANSPKPLSGTFFPRLHGFPGFIITYFLPLFFFHLLFFIFHCQRICATWLFCDPRLCKFTKYIWGTINHKRGYCDLGFCIAFEIKGLSIRMHLVDCSVVDWLKTIRALMECWWGTGPGPVCRMSSGGRDQNCFAKMEH